MLTYEEKYEKHKDWCNRKGYRVQSFKDFKAVAGHFTSYAVHPLIQDCEPMMFIIGEELCYLRDIDSKDYIDKFIIPYYGFEDMYTRYATSIGIDLMDLEGFIKREGDFKMNIHTKDKKTGESIDTGKTMSIRDYIDNPDYAKYVLCDDNAIFNFIGDFAFMSNFFKCKVTYNGLTYATNENAYQAQKTLDEDIRKEFTTMEPGNAKKRGRLLDLRPEWEDVKIDIMREIVKAKFDQHPDLAELLLNTGNRLIVEGNVWKDTFWGVSRGKGKNWLGRILMETRNELRSNKEEK